MHEGQLPRVVQFETGYTLTVRQGRRLYQLPQLPPVNEDPQNVLLDVLIVVVDGGKKGWRFSAPVSSIFDFSRACAAACVEAFLFSCLLPRDAVDKLIVFSMLRRSSIQAA